MKNPKTEKRKLRRDTVSSNTFHVGIELELIAPGDGSERNHDDEACSDSAHERERDDLESQSTVDLIRDQAGSISLSTAQAVEPFFNRDAYIDERMDNFSHDCDDSDCPYYSGGECDRDSLREELVTITANQSFKVVEDSSIDCDGDEFDAEVCWNYFASKETIQDNSKILKFLEDKGLRFDSSCGLHINLNNYLELPQLADVPIEKLEFLFNVVASSRRNSTYCNREAISGQQKYSMIYHQGDRLEFRFFSPTLEAEKLNHYVTLAQHVYRRLAGKKRKLPKKTAKYLRDKMVKVNKVDADLATKTIKQINAIPSYAKMLAVRKPRAMNRNPFGDQVESIIERNNRIHSEAQATLSTTALRRARELMRRNEGEYALIHARAEREANERIQNQLMGNWSDESNHIDSRFENEFRGLSAQRLENAIEYYVQRMTDQRLSPRDRQEAGQRLEAAQRVSLRLGHQSLSPEENTVFQNMVTRMRVMSNDELREYIDQFGRLQANRFNSEVRAMARDILLTRQVNPAVEMPNGSRIEFHPENFSIGSGEAIRRQGTQFVGVDYADALRGRNFAAVWVDESVTRAMPSTEAVELFQAITEDEMTPLVAEGETF